MSEPDARLGINFDANKLYYAISRPVMPGSVERIGAIDFSFNLVESITTRNADTLSGVAESLNKLVTEYGVSEIRMVLPPSFECWSTVPKSVFDVEEERTMHLNLIMKGIDPHEIQPQWHQLSNRDFKLVSVRRKNHLDSFASLMDNVTGNHLYSDFEIGKTWMKHNRFYGSFLSISSYKGIISVSSFLLGKLRAATYIHYDDPGDLPYLWLQYASHLPWIEGLHEYVMIFGVHSTKIIESLKDYWDDSSEILLMNSLKKMNLKSDEETFSFPLEEAFPAALLSTS